MDHPTLDSDAISASTRVPDGFATIFDRHFEAVHAYLQRRVGPDLADELSAQTFLVAFDMRGGYDPAQPDARPWLFGIATNLLRRHHRNEVRQFRAYARSAVDPVLDAFDGVEARLDASKMRRELVDGPPGEAETFTLIGDMLRNTHELIFDPKTSALLGEREVAARRIPELHVPAGTETGATAYLDSKVVDSLGRGAPPGAGHLRQSVGCYECTRVRAGTESRHAGI